MVGGWMARSGQWRNGEIEIPAPFVWLATPVKQEVVVGTKGK